MADEITIVSDQRFTWKGREKLNVRPGSHKFEPGYHLISYVQLDPPVAATSLDLRSDWRLYALGTSYGFILYDYANKHSVVNRCTLNVQDFAIVSGDVPGAGAITRKKSFRKSLRESFRRLRRGRSQRNQPLVTGTVSAANDPSSAPTKPAFSRVTTGVRALNSAPSLADSGNNVQRNVYSTERQVEPKVELSSIVKCITLTSAIITNNSLFTPTLWAGTNSGQVLVYAINLATEQKSGDSGVASQSDNQQQAERSAASGNEPSLTTARLAKEIQLKHKAPIIAIFTTPDAPPQQVTEHQSSTEGTKLPSPDRQQSEQTSADGLMDKSDAAERKSLTESPDSNGAERARTPTPLVQQQQQQQPQSVDKSPKKDKEAIQPRVLICSEEQFKVFNLPNLKPFCKFKLTAHEGLRAKKISITQFMRPGSNKQAGSNAALLTSSKSLQSFATQTSPPASPVPPQAETGGDGGAESGPARNNGDESASETKMNSENNNNSLSTLNNNHNSGNATTKQDSKELMNAKFGTKTNNIIAHESKDSGAVLERAADQANLFEPYMVCMSNQGDCAIYSVPDLKRQAQIQVCKREDVNGITSTMLTNYGEGYYLKSSSNFLRFSISSQRVLRVLSVV